MAKLIRCNKCGIIQFPKCKNCTPQLDPNVSSLISHQYGSPFVDVRVCLDELDISTKIAIPPLYGVWFIIPKIVGDLFILWYNSNTEMDLADFLEKALTKEKL